MILKKTNDASVYNNIETSKEEFINLFKELVKRKGANKLLEWLEKSDFFTAPASTKYHSNVKGGLCIHSLFVYRRLLKLLDSEGYNIEDENIKSTAFIVAALHDLCKVDFYKETTRNVKVDGQWVTVPYYAVDEKLVFGHGEKSVYILQSFMKITREEALAIRWHMGDFSEAHGGCSIAYEQYPLATMLHIADLQATYLDESIFDYETNSWK